jgi:hypothetical protein
MKKIEKIDFKNTYGLLIALLSVGTMTTTVFLAGANAPEVFDDTLLFVIIAGLISTLFSINFAWNLFKAKSWHRIAGVGGIAWGLFTVFQILRLILSNINL